MSEHPTPETLKSFLLGRLPAEGVRQVTRHLLTRCSQCRSHIEPLATAMFRPGKAEGSPLTEEAVVYDHAVHSACSAALERRSLLQRERTEASAKMMRLLTLGGSEKDQRLPQQPEFWTWGLCE